MTKVLVTGGAGFIGGNFIHHMIEKYPSYKIYNLDSLTYAGDLIKHEKFQSYSNYTFCKLDINDRKAVTELFFKEQFNFVVHFAAESHVDRSILDPGIFVQTNVLGTQILLEAAKAVSVQKFVHVSTDEVYGDLPFEPNLYFTEETPLQPNSPYSASKASSDLMVRAYHETYQLPVNITRCSNNYGPYHFPEKLIPLAITRVMEGQKVPVYGAGSNIRDWLHVQDHCAAVDLVLHEGAAGEVYNIGGHNEKSNLEVVKTIINMLGSNNDLIEFVEDRLGHDRRYAIDPSKIEALGWKPRHSFESGIAETIQWYQQNQLWWQRILSGEYRQYFERQYSFDQVNG